MSIEFNGLLNGIHVDTDGYFNLNDMVKFFPTKHISHWLENVSTKEFVNVIEKSLNPHLDDNLNTRVSGELKFIPALKTKRGRHGGGTYAHKYVAMKFAMWLSPEFELEVIKAYENGIERKEVWDIHRIMAANGYKLLVETVSDKVVPEFEKNNKNPYYAYTEEADLLNLIVFGKKASEAGGNQRDTASKIDLQLIEYLQRLDPGLIEAGLDYQRRKDKLTELCDRKRIKLLEESNLLLK